MNALFWGEAALYLVIFLVLLYFQFSYFSAIIIMLWWIFLELLKVRHILEKDGIKLAGRIK